MRRLLRKGDAFPFDFNTLLRLPRVEHVVYLFWSKSKASFVYIGKTDRGLSKRMREHRQKCDNPTLRAWIRHAPKDLIVCYVTCPACLVLKLERRLIRQFDPNANKDHKT